jgi:hypothetical protein
MTSWRDVLKVHAAAEMFPLMSPDELKELGRDIKKNGLTAPPVQWVDRNGEAYLLDGRNRLDAMEAVGIVVVEVTPGSAKRKEKVYRWDPAGRYRLSFDRYDWVTDPWEYVVSANLRRRHLGHEEKRRIIAALLKARPERSDRATAKLAKPSTPSSARSMSSPGR